MTPVIYGLPNNIIHKLNVPLRPIVYFYTCPTYNLSKHLARLLSPLVGNKPSEVNNSREFVDFVRSIRLDESELMVSFDVVSLFTDIPVKLAQQVAQERLESDDTLSDRTKLSVKEIMSLLSLCLHATYFSF